MCWKRVVIGVIIGVLYSPMLWAQHVSPVPQACPPSWTSCVPSTITIDPQFELLRQVVVRQGVRSGFFGPNARAAHPLLRPTPRTDGVGASLRMNVQLNALQHHVLERAGVRLLGEGLGHPGIGWVYRAWVPWAGVDALKRLPGLIRAEVAWRPLIVAPLAQTVEEVGALAAHQRPDTGVTGRGVVVADIDSGVDVLHPAFFHADGGLFEWIDINDNGVFEPGVDAIDYNRDAQASLSEVARVLDGTLIPDFSSEGVINRDKLLDPTLDWLYTDQNRDFKRNAGEQEGFLESDPGYGEPAFVVDDVNGNGVLDPGERVALLDTSKIWKFVSGAREYLRGIDLIESANTRAIDQSFHGTSVSGILLGGQRGYHARIGVAPDAELIMYNNYDTRDLPQGWEDDLQIRFVQDAQLSGAHMVLHEWTSPFTSPMDGSSNLEAAMDVAYANGVAQVNPLGNLNRSQKHLTVPVTAQQDASLEFVVGAGFQSGASVLPYTIVYTSLQWRSEQTPGVVLISPDGRELKIDLNTTAQLLTMPGGTSVAMAYDRTPRATSLLRLTIYNADNTTPLTQGRWAIRLEDILEDDVVYARVSDFYSSWGVGVRWSAPTTDSTTLSFPSTADSAIGVAAYGGRSDMVDDGTVVGQLRGYSGRGPRVDGQRAVDIAAPDDPYSPLAATPQARANGWGRSWYGPFGGTSGAGPHVAGALALSIEARPERTLPEHERALFESARTQDLSPAWSGASQNDTGWGEGKLSIFPMVYGEQAPVNQPPTLVVEARLESRGVMVDLSASTDPEGRPLQARVDYDYDGEFDTPWGALEQRVEYPEDLARTPLFKVQIRDNHGEKKAALIPYSEDVLVPPIDASPDATPPDDMTSTPPPRDTMAPEDSVGCFGCAQTPARPDGGLLVFVVGVGLMWARSRRAMAQA